MNKKRIGTSIICLILLIVSMFALSACGGKVKNFNLSFKVDGEVYETLVTDGETSVAIPENPSKEGYIFDGWYWDEGVWEKPFTANSLLDAPISSDMSVYAKFNAIEYDITYNVDGGTHNNPVSYTIEDSFALQDAEKTDYSFIGWYLDSSWTTKVETISTGTTGDITLYAKFEIENYSITYTNTKDVVNNNPTSYNVNSDTIVLTNLSKDGYAFDGWYNGVDKITEIPKGSTGDLTLEAKWTAVEYEIIYHNVNDATNNNPENYNVDEQPLVLVDLEKDGYNFLGWFTDENFANEITEISVGATGEINLYAKWQIIEYTATFMDGTTIVKEVKFTVETESIDEPAVPNHVGYNGEWEDYTLGTENITIDAVYTAIEYTATFMDGTTVVKEVKFTVETESIDEPAVPVHVGYNGEWEDYTLGTEDITIDAVYMVITYNIEYLNTKDVKSENPKSYTIESETIILDNISKKGYQFDGWYNNAGNKVERIEKGSYGNITLTARWTTLTYTIAYLYDNAYGDLEEGKILKTSYTIEDEFTFEELVCKNEGFNFRGWFTEKNVGTGDKVLGVTKGMTGDITVYAQFGLETYDISYINVNGATNSNPTHYDVETDDFVIAPLSKEGYNFDGWFANEQCTDEANLTITKGSYGDITLYAKWTAIVYTIEYVTYGGTALGNQETYTITDSLTLNDATLSGYVFKGWYTAAEGGNKVTKIDKGTTGNIILYAHWDYISTITFESNGGSEVDSISNVEGTTIIAPTAPTKEHYIFAGWYSDVDLTKTYSFTIQPEKDITLYAKWTPFAYDIEYVLNGGSNSSNNVKKYTVEDKVEIYAASKVGYTFIGWFTDSEFTSTIVTEIKKGTSGKITLYAHYSINQYTISFEENGGTTVADITQNYATEVVEPEAPAKNGYTFAGWYSNSSLTSKYTFSTMPAKNVTLYAKWNLASYKITYNLNGGTNNSSNPATYTITSAKITLKAPTKTGYNFAGWFTDAECTQAITEIKSGSYGDLELFAKWTAITYTITYIMPDGTINNNATTYTIETDLTDLTNASVKGYDFVGWYSDSDYKTAITTIGGGETGNKTIYGKFNPATYNVWLDGNEEAKAVVSFNLNGGEGSVADQTITPTVTLKYPTNPTRAGYIFGGWYDNETCEGSSFDFTAIVTKDITLYAKWVKVENVSVIAINGSANITLNGKTEQKLMFVPLVSGNITITSSGSYDTFGVLYNSNMVALIQDDDTASDGINYHIVYNVTAGETYYIGTRAFSSTTTGTATVSISGNTAVPDGGYTITTTKASVTYGSHFTFNIPSARDGYKFLGYADENGIMYTDSTGASIKVWDKDQNTTLYSVWEKMVYTVTFNTSGGTSIDSIELAFGERLDISKYVTTRTNYSFDCWYLGDDVFEATTMPDHDITLEASWKRYSIGTIKFDDGKTAISYKDVITAELFGVYAIDTDGKFVEFTITVNNVAVSDYTLTAGETVSVKFVAGTKQKVITAKVYGMPTLNYTASDYVNIPNGLTASAFSANGLDTFGNATTIRVSIIGEYKAGDVVSVLIESIDVAGNITTATVENVKVYGVPTITYNEDKTAISVSDTIDATLFGATATDSFGEPLTVTVSRYSGTQSAGNTITIKFTATDSKGNITTFTKQVKVYGAPTISSATKTEFKENVSDIISPETLGLTAKDTFNNSLDISLTLKSGSRVGGTTMVYTASVTDIAGNTTTKDITVKIYGTPTINVDRTDIKVTENPVTTPSVLKATAKDSFNNSLSVKVTLKLGTVAGGNEVVYTITATDKLGNVATLDKTVKVYDVNDIDFTYSKRASDVIKVDSKGEEFFAEATDSFGEDCVITIEAASGYTLTAGKIISLYVVATDKVGNVVKSDLIEGISVYGTPIVNTASEFLYEDTDLNIFITAVTDSFGEELVAEITYSGDQVANEDITFSIKAQDEFGNVLDTTLSFTVIPKGLVLISNGNECSVVGYAGTPSTLVLRDSYNGKPLTSIGSSAFYYCDSLTSVTIGNSVTSIGDYAFEDCTSLASVTIGNSVTSIGSEAFRNCDSLTSITIPNSVTSIGYDAFYDCDSLTSVTIGNSVTSIGSYAFYYCFKLVEVINKSVSITVEKGITNGYLAFYTLSVSNCDDSYVSKVSTDSNGYITYTDGEDKILLGYKGTETELTLPSDITKIYQYAFCNNDNITSVTIGDSVTSIGSHAFAYCYALTNVTIPDSVTGIGDSSFYDCTSLTRVDYTGTIDEWVEIEFGSSTSNPLYYAKNLYIGGELVTEANLTTATKISDYAFCNCTSLQSVTIGNSVISIGLYAFNDCDQLTSVELGNGVTSIGAHAFNDCDQLTSLTIGGSVTSIGSYAFNDCDQLISVTIEGGVTSIGDYAFEYCGSLTIYCKVKSKPSGWSSYWNNSNCPVVWDYKNNDVAVVDSIYVVDNIKYSIKDGAATVVGRSQNMPIVNIPSSITYKGTIYPVTSIGDHAFNDCRSLTSITIPNSVTSIGSYAFRTCRSLTSVEIPNSVTSIGEGAFAGCDSLTSMTIPFVGASLNGTYDDDFKNLFYFEGHQPLIPKALKEVIITGGTSIGDRAFSYFRSLISVEIPNSVTSIGYEAFSGCSSLTSIEIPNSVTSIGSYAFDDCNSLTIYCEAESKPNGWDYRWGYGNCTVVWDYKNNEVATDGYVYIVTNDIRYGIKDGVATLVGQPVYLTTENIPSSITYKGTIYPVTSIGPSAFSGCTQLTSIEIPNSVTSTGQEAFRGCSSLTSIEIPNSVTSIGQEAFYGCSLLTSITVDENHPNYKSIDGNLYSKDGKILIQYATGKNDTGFIIPISVTSIGDYAFYGCSRLASIVIPDSVTSIGVRAFYECSSLTSVTIGNSVTSIGSSAFYDCSRLVSITIPNSVTSIGREAFRGCSRLAIYCEAESKPNGWNDYWNYSNCPVVWDYKNNEVATDGNIYVVIDNIRYALKDGEATVVKQAKNIATAIIPTSVTYKGQNYPVTSIGSSAFYNCTSLTSIKFSDTTTWYRTSSETDWKNKTGGTQTSVTNSSTNATYFKSTYYKYYWYKI